MAMALGSLDAPRHLWNFEQSTKFHTFDHLENMLPIAQPSHRQRAVREKAKLYLSAVAGMTHASCTVQKGTHRILNHLDLKHGKIGMFPMASRIEFKTFPSSPCSRLDRCFIAILHCYQALVAQWGWWVSICRDPMKRLFVWAHQILDWLMQMSWTANDQKEC